MLRSRTDIRVWLAFLLGAVMCVLALSYGKVRKERSGLLVFDATSTQPGMLKVFYQKTGNSPIRVVVTNDTVA